MQKIQVSILILFLALFTAGCSRTDTTRTAFKTPEEAITYYLDGVAQNDIRKILQACAINEMGGNFRFDLYAERVGAWNPTENLSPTDHPFYSEINKTYLSSQILKQVKNHSYS